MALRDGEIAVGRVRRRRSAWFLPMAAALLILAGYVGYTAIGEQETGALPPVPTATPPETALVECEEPDYPTRAALNVVGGQQETALMVAMSVAIIRGRTSANQPFLSAGIELASYEVLWGDLPDDFDRLVVPGASDENGGALADATFVAVVSRSDGELVAGPAIFSCSRRGGEAWTLSPDGPVRTDVGVGGFGQEILRTIAAAHTSVSLETEPRVQALDITGPGGVATTLLMPETLGGRFHIWHVVDGATDNPVTVVSGREFTARVSAVEECPARSPLGYCSGPFVLDAAFRRTGTPPVLWLQSQDAASESAAEDESLLVDE